MTASCVVSARGDRQLLEPTVNESHGHSSLTDRAGDPLCRAASYVSGGEEARHAGLERERVRSSGQP